MMHDFIYHNWPSETELGTTLPLLAVLSCDVGDCAPRGAYHQRQLVRHERLHHSFGCITYAPAEKLKGEKNELDQVVARSHMGPHVIDNQVTILLGPLKCTITL